MKSKITATEIAADIIRWSEAREEEIERERNRADKLATDLVLLQEQYLSLQVGMDRQSDNESSQSEEKGNVAMTPYDDKIQEIIPKIESCVSRDGEVDVYELRRVLSDFLLTCVSDYHPQKGKT